MSHQFSFYMTPKDTINVEQRIRELAPVSILHSRSISPSPRSIDSLNFIEDGKPWWFLFLARTQDLQDIVTKFVPSQNYWVINDLVSPVVEFERSSFDSEILRRGRIYYRDGFYDKNGSWINKNDEFRGWAKKVSATVKKYLTRRASSYIGPDALAWLESSGGKLAEL